MPELSERIGQLCLEVCDLCAEECARHAQHHALCGPCGRECRRMPPHVDGQRCLTLHGRIAGSGLVAASSVEYKPARNRLSRTMPARP